MIKILYHLSKKLISSMIPVAKKMGYSKKALTGGFDEAAKMIKLSNLSDNERETLLTVLEEVKKEV